jgi:signal transduction histidine kinase
VELVVRDDGLGFDVQAARKRAAAGASLGLLTMRERASLAGGTLSIESAPGRGTIVCARFPATLH